MELCPKTISALDADWEKLRFFKGPNPVRGLGAWDEDSVTEAYQVRSRARQINGRDRPLGSDL